MRSNAQSVIELRAKGPYSYSFVEQFLLSTSRNRLPQEIAFYVVKGKRWSDIIVYNQSVSINFYSQKLIDILRNFINMENICYPIQIANCQLSYYTIYNLKELSFINQAYRPTPDPFPCFVLQDNMPHLFTLTNSNLKVCSADVKDAIEKAKLKNIYFREIHGLSEAEYAEWREKHKDNTMLG